MSDVVFEARRVKKEALAKRDAGELEAARNLLETAVRSLRASREELVGERGPEAPSPLERAMAEVEIQLWGSLGGIYRRWQGQSSGSEELARLREAVNAYDEGFLVEQDPAYGFDESYNRVQRLVCRLLLRPDAGDEPVEGVRVQSALDEAREVVDAQLEWTRIGDEWALADAALLRTTLGGSDHEAAWRRFCGAGPSDEAVETNLAVLDDLIAVSSGQISERARRARQILDPEKTADLPIRRAAFIIMPFGIRPRPGESIDADYRVNFDDVDEKLQEGLEQAHVQAIRADDDSALRGFIHRPMLERIVVSELGVADLTFGNGNVLYELGVRHGTGAPSTFLICERRAVAKLPFDVGLLKVHLYDVDPSGAIEPEAADRLRSAIARWAAQAEEPTSPSDNPIAQVTNLLQAGDVAHEQADVLIDRMRRSDELSARISAVLDTSDDVAGLSELQAIERELLRDADVRQLISTRLALFIAYREVRAYEDMLRFGAKLPSSIQRVQFVLEQRGFAHTRLGEARAQSDPATAQRHWRLAERVLLSIDPADRTSETFALLGRLHKGQWLHERSGPRGRGHLEKAINFYEEGFRRDSRDFYPGVNLVTLLIARGDHDRARATANVVQFAVESQILLEGGAETDPNEGYWREACQLELACAERRWSDAERLVQLLSTRRVRPWMQESTAQNLRIHRAAYPRDSEARARIDEYLQALVGG